MKCIMSGREVLYPCSSNCPLFVDCMVMFRKDTKPVTTNADRIRAMSDEELAEFLTEVENRRSIYCGGAVWEGLTNTLMWLRQPAEVDNE